MRALLVVIAAVVLMTVSGCGYLKTADLQNMLKNKQQTLAFYEGKCRELTARIEEARNRLEAKQKELERLREENAVLKGR